MRTVTGIDGWWPRLQWPYVLCGASNATVVDVRTGAVIEVAEGAWPAGWIPRGPGQRPAYVITREVAPDVRQAAIVTVGENTPILWGPEFPCGGPVLVFEGALWFGGHAAYTPHVAGLWRGNFSGTGWQQVIGGGTSVYGMSMRAANERLAAHLLLADGSEPWTVRDAIGQIDLLPSDHLCIPGPGVLHGMGYYGPALLRGGGRDHDVTVTPWRAEGVPFPFTYNGELWVATATAALDYTGVILRPVEQKGITTVLQRDGFEAAHLDVAVVGTSAWVVGNSDKGLLTIDEVDLRAPRAPFLSPPVTQPVPDLPPGPGWVPVNEEIDTMRFLAGAAWSREGSPRAGTSTGVLEIYTHGFQSRRETRDDGTGWVQHSKIFRPHAEGEPVETFAVLVFSPDGVGISFDRTNELAEGYRILAPSTDRTAIIFPRYMRPGQERRTLVEILDLQTGRRVPWVCIARCVGVYAARAVGSIPPVRHATLYYAFEDNNGFEEWNTCAEHHGPWAWEERRRGATRTRRWEGVFTVPRRTDADPSRYTDPPVDSSGPPVRATIVQPSAWPVSVSVGAGVRCVAKVTQGTAVGFQWQRRLLGGEWWNEHTEPRPATDNDHTYRFSTPGTYEVRLITHGMVGQDATGSSRKVLVR